MDTRHRAGAITPHNRCVSTEPPNSQMVGLTGKQRQILCVTAETAQCALMRPEISLECGTDFVWQVMWR
jgi:hypothetical protein